MFLENFYLWFICLVLVYFIFLFGYLQLSDKNDKINNFIAFGALYFVFLHILAFLLLMYQSAYLRSVVLENWLIVLCLPIIGFGIIVILSTFLIILYRLFFRKKDFKEVEKKWRKKMNEMNKAKRDTYRKISHVIIFIVLFILWAVGYNYVTKSTQSWAGMIPNKNNMLELYLNIISEPESIRTSLYALGWFYYLIFFFFYILCLFMLINELTRKSKYFAFPFNFLPKMVMSEEEIESYGTYLYFFIGQMFASFLCPPMVYFAILGMSGIADLTTSQVGIRWGKHRIKWNKKKTWEGNIAGTIVAFIICFPFIGIIWSIIFAIAFQSFDLFTDQPFKISDNLLIPIGCAIIFILIRYYLDLDYYALVYQFFS
ncbi:MAG: hypothetical protein ACTSQP_02240 [Promethearchaeota archaeon]